MARSRATSSLRDPYDFDSDIEDTSLTKSSFIYGMLPRIVKARRLPSFRRSLSGYNKVYKSNTASPPPEYQSSASLCESEADEHEEKIPATPPRRRENVARSDGSGVHWKFANQGLNLLGLSTQEAASTEEGGRKSAPASSTSLARHMYIHGLTYILRGLPDDLNADEKVSIWSAVPDSVNELAAGRGDAQDLLVTQTESSQLQEGELHTAQPSSLHRFLAMLIVQLCIIATFIAPYLRALLAIVYRYEREHRVSERVFASGVDTVDWSVKKSVAISGSVARMNNGKIGQIMNDVMVWWIKGVTGGIHQGVGEGMDIMSTGDTTRRKKKQRGRMGIGS